jgi:CDP-glucose 4,6-dehydratase
MNENQFKNKKIIITGHTGFKGSWLTAWLTLLGAKIIGISSGIPSNPSHFKFLNLKRKIKHLIVDIRDARKLKKVFVKEKPDYVFHLAAQAIVRKSYLYPKLTFETNTIGTLNVLEAIKMIKKKCIAVLITSDKVYKNLEINRGYNENDILGGYDAYSASKASAELVIQSYIKCFFRSKKNNKFIAVARAGNVIGGGDWSEDRLIPDCVKSWSKKKPVKIRSPKSTRPWQHVLEALNGYLTLAIKLKNNSNFHGEVFNFGPNKYYDLSVISVMKLIKKNWKDAKWKIIKNKNNYFYESKLLKINSSKAKKYLKWRCVLSFNETIDMISYWYKNFYKNKKVDKKFTFKQIKDFENILKIRNR